MRTLLINPPFYRFVGFEQDYAPISLLSVGAWYEKLGHEVKILNLEIDKDSSYVGYKGRAEGFDNYLDQIENDNHPVWNQMRDTINTIGPDHVGITVVNVKYKSAMKIIEIIFHLIKKKKNL